MIRKHRQPGPAVAPPNPVNATMEEMRKLYEENRSLYERLLASEREKVELLKAQIGS